MASDMGVATFDYCCGHKFAYWFKRIAREIRADGSQIIELNEQHFLRRLKRPCHYCGARWREGRVVITFQKGGKR